MQTRVGVGTVAIMMLLASTAGAKPAKKPAAPAFDREAAATTLKQVDLKRCKATNAPAGVSHVKLTFDPSGAVSEAVVDSGPIMGTAIGTCVQNQFKQQAKVPAFDGKPVTVGKSFSLR